MKHALRAAAVLALIVSFSGCDLLFSGSNLFAKVDGPDTAKLTSSEGTELVTLLEESQSSDGTFGATFVAALDDSQVDTIVANLDEIYTDAGGIYTEEQQAEAANLAADLLLAATDAGDVVNGVVSSIMTTMSDGGSLSPDTLIANIFGSDDLSADDFAALAADMTSLFDAYSALDTSLEAGADGPDLGLGDGQAAVVAIVFDALLSSVDTANPSYTDPVQAIYDVLIAPTQDGTGVSDTEVAALFNGTDMDGLFTDITTNDASNPYYDLYQATGVDSFLALLNS